MNDKLSTLEKIGNWFSTLLLGKTKEIIVRTDERVSNITAIVSELKTDIKSIRNSLVEHGQDIVGLKVYTKYGISNSPAVPSETGDDLLKVSGFYKVYPELKPKIFALMEAKNLRTLYDYERSAQKALEDLRDNPLMDGMKDHSVNHPEEPLELIFRVASWVIRDDYAKDHRL